MAILHRDLLTATSHLSVLLVEDYLPFAKEMNEVLTELFDDVVLVNDGKNGLDAYIQYHQKYQKYFDIVITDLRLPKMCGVELSKEIRQINNGQNIIVISSYTESEDLLELLNLGIKRFLKKPINYDELCNVLYDVSCDCVCDIGSHEDTKNDISLGLDYVWNSEEKVLYANDKQVYCTRHETILLDFLIANKERVCSLAMLIDYFRDENIDISPKSIRNLVLSIRKKTYSECIQNIYGLGYCIYGK